jgi:hypothetical protein
MVRAVGPHFPAEKQPLDPVETGGGGHSWLVVGPFKRGDRTVNVGIPGGGRTPARHDGRYQMQWHFYQQGPTDPVLNPIASEFFASEAVGDAADALVREAIQNSLDARRGGAKQAGSPARVRIHLSGEDGALLSTAAKDWFGTIWPHVSADGNGLAERPVAGETCPFIVVEDFGTTGLDGDPSAFAVDRSRPNDFLNFFRAVGYSDKGQNSKGSWGVGKTVFPRSSRISSFIGYTVRASDDRRMLLGRSILRYHSVGGVPYKSDGYSGVQRSDGFVLPSEDADVIGEFQRDFRIERRGETGLSVVVPWYTTSGDNAITPEGILRAVVSGFFHPMLAGDLVVEIDTATGRTRLDSHTLPEVLASQDGTWAAEKLAVIELARWWRQRNGESDGVLTAPTTNRAQKWLPGAIPEEIVGVISPKLMARERFAVRVPMHVLLREGDPKPTHFDVICEATDDDTTTVMFIRDGLIIPDVRPTRRTRGIRAIVIVEDDALAGFLRDAETPAHTEWTTGTSNFRDKYKFGAGGIEFVKAAVPELINALRSVDTQPDENIAIEHFYIEREASKSGRKRRKKPTVRVPTRPRRFRINRLDGGFSLRPPGDGGPSSDGGEAGVQTLFEPFAVSIRAAYDVRSGSAINAWSPFDFDVAKRPIVIEQSGVEIRSLQGRQMIVIVNQSEFHVSVRGFDRNRDLFVEARVLKEKSGDDPEV